MIGLPTRRAPPVALALLCALASARVHADAELPQATPAQEPPPATSWTRYLNPANAPFLPIPEITTDPDSGTTVGLLPTWLQTDDEHHIRQIIAPDVLHNPYFGWGGHARLFAYPSTDEQWSAVVGVKQRVERSADLEYETGRLREQRWSFNASLLYDRDGTPRFYGIGNDSPQNAQTNYTSERELAQAQIGLNLTKAWQLLYTARWQQVNVLPGTLPGIPSVQELFAGTLGRTREFLNRLSLVYDTRNDLTVPSRGVRWIAYGGVALGDLSGETLYSEAGLDGDVYLPIRPTTILAMHGALRYMPSVESAAFWQLSSIGGGHSIIGGQQPLRGFGAGRFTDRNSFSLTAELRQLVFSRDLFNTHAELEVAPFIDTGRVFARASTSPFADLHNVYGIGFRGIARPFVVGYVDVGYSREGGTAVFTGLNYPF